MFATLCDPFTNESSLASFELLMAWSGQTGVRPRNIPVWGSRCSNGLRSWFKNSPFLWRPTYNNCSQQQCTPARGGGCSQRVGRFQGWVTLSPTPVSGLSGWSHTLTSIQRWQQRSTACVHTHFAAAIFIPRCAVQRIQSEECVHAQNNSDKNSFENHWLV